jgi:hypothetical protein
VGILAVENSSFGYINRAKHAWGGELGKIEGYDRVDEERQLESRTDPFGRIRSTNSIYVAGATALVTLVRNCWVPKAPRL